MFMSQLRRTDDYCSKKSVKMSLIFVLSTGKWKSVQILSAPIFSSSSPFFLPNANNETALQQPFQQPSDGRFCHFLSWRFLVNINVRLQPVDGIFSWEAAFECSQNPPFSWQLDILRKRLYQISPHWHTFPDHIVSLLLFCLSSSGW